MKIFFDTEFIENGKTIELLSIGLVREDGKQLYLEADWTDWLAASEWVRDNVIVHLGRTIGVSASRSVMQDRIIEFAGDKPEFWAYYGAYDWVSLCQIYGTMMELPPRWPSFCMDTKQLAMDLGNPRLPEQISVKHHALNDALFTREAYEFLFDLKARLRK